MLEIKDLLEKIKVKIKRLSYFNNCQNIREKPLTKPRLLQLLSAMVFILILIFAVYKNLIQLCFGSAYRVDKSQDN